METKIKNSFKAVDFMRQVRNELSDIYHADKQCYHALKLRLIALYFSPGLNVS
jgi:hypothetical protein